MISFIDVVPTTPILTGRRDRLAGCIGSPFAVLALRKSPEAFVLEQPRRHVVVDPSSLVRVVRAATRRLWLSLAEVLACLARAGMLPPARPLTCGACQVVGAGAAMSGITSVERGDAASDGVSPEEGRAPR